MHGRRDVAPAWENNPVFQEDRFFLQALDFILALLNVLVHLPEILVGVLCLMGGILFILLLMFMLAISQPPRNTVYVRY